MILDRTAILAASDLKTEDVEVPEWGGTVRVRSMSAAERDAFEDTLRRDGKADMRNFRAKLAAFCLVDQQGERMFTDADIAALGAKSAAALDRVVTVAQALNVLGAAAVEDAAKNSAAAPGGSSPSA